MVVQAQALRHIESFQTLSMRLLKELALSTQVITCRQRHIFFEQGMTIAGIYVITAGMIKLYRQSHDRSQILALLGPNDFFGTEVLSELHTSYGAAAITQVDALHFPLDVLNRLMEQDVEFRTVILHLVTTQLRLLASVVHSLAFRNVPSRLANVLLQLVDMQGESRPDGLYVPRILTQTELAEMVGTAREVIHRTFNKFAQSAVLQLTPSHIIIFDIERLQSIATEETR